MKKSLLPSFENLKDRLFQPVDSASLVFFRIAFGLLMFWEITRYFSHDWIRRYWIDPVFLFSYEGFEWIRPWDGNGMYIHFLVLAVLALFIAMGLAYRLSSLLFFLGFTYVFLLDKTHYLNHFYLISLLSGLLVFLPLNRRFSLDAQTGWVPASDTVPAWSLYLLQAQLFIVYFYGGIAKLNADWLRGVPMDKWMAQATDFPLIGTYFTEHWAVMALVYGGLLFDLLIGPFLLMRWSRPYAFFVALLFHLTNAHLFIIGVFPWFMIAATTLFFEPSWCKRLIPAANLPVLPVPPLRPGFTLTLLGLFLLVQLLIPFRHFLYPGNVSWTEEGHRFAWHMKLRQKAAKARFEVIDPASGKTWMIHPRRFLSKRQVGKMACRPDMILQFSHYLQRYYAHNGYPEVEVYAHAYASLNGRKPMRQLVKSEVNLAQVRPSLKPADWIWPMDQAPAHAEKEPEKLADQQETPQKQE